MKNIKILLIFIFLLLVLSGCKDNEDNSTLKETSYVGNQNVCLNKDNCQYDNNINYCYGNHQFVDGVCESCTKEESSYCNKKHEFSGSHHHNCKGNHNFVDDVCLKCGKVCSEK